MYVCCPCAQDAVLLQLLSGVAISGCRPGCCRCLQIQSGNLLPLSNRFHPAGVYVVRKQQVTCHCCSIYPLFATFASARVLMSHPSLSSQTSQHLTCPGVCIGALASVEGLSDALIGTDECGRLFVWWAALGQIWVRLRCWCSLHSRSSSLQMLNLGSSI